MSVGSATAYGHGPHPDDKANTNASKPPSLPNSKVGPQNDDLEGEQMRAAGEGEVMRAQTNKEDAGWGEEGSLTSDLDRKKEEQKEKRQEVQAQRDEGVDVDGGSGGRVQNEGLGSV